MPSVTPSSGDAGEPLPPELHRAFRSSTMRGSYLAEDRPEIKFCSEEAARFMANPTTVGHEMVKRYARFLLGPPILVQRMERQDFCEVADGYSDSDHAGCKRTRRSTSCAILMHGKHFIKMLCSTQIPIALSSAESEWHALVRTASALLGFVNMAKDFGRVLVPRLHLDAEAAKGIACRRGVGRIRHLDTTTLWLQSLVTNRRIQIRKILGTQNPADLGTKHLGRIAMWKCLEMLGYQKLEGRSKHSLRAALS